MRKITHKNKRVHQNFFGIIFILLIIFTAFLGIKIYHTFIARPTDISDTNEESYEMQQNTIPKDVLAYVQKEEHVLGAKSTAPIKPTSVHVPILMYHYVEYVTDLNDTNRIKMNTLPEILEAQIQTLQKAGYTFMTNAELAEVLDGKAKLPQKPILLTFDDGYRDFYTDAYPQLKKYHVKATQYVITGSEFLNTPNHMTTAQVQEIAKDGLVEIAAHTVDHLWLKGETKAIDTYQVTQSKKDLEHMIGKPVVSFAYPYGALDEQAIQAVKDAGYTSAVSTIPGIDQLQSQRYFLYRLRPGAMTGPALLTCLNNVATCYGLSN